MRAFLALAAFVIGFGLANRLVASRVPLPPEAGLRAKVEYAKNHIDAIDVLFVGSSATLYGIRPDIFEAELARRGYPDVNAFNLGVGGMGSFEALQVLRQVLAGSPDKLAWVLYEEPQFDPLLWYPNVFNPRYVHWHDLRTTRSAIASVALTAAPPEYKRAEYEADWLGRFDWKFALIKEHAALFSWRFASLGQGSLLFDESFGPTAPLWPDGDALEAQKGWMDIALDPEPGALRAHEKFVADPAAWQARVAALRNSAGARPDLEGTYDLDALEELLSSIRGVGAEPLIYVAPRGLPSPKMSSLLATGRIDALFTFQLPGQYPELADPALRWDASHLDAAGAEVWSRLFARDFANHLDATGLAARRR